MPNVDNQNPRARSGSINSKNYIVFGDLHAQGTSPQYKVKDPLNPLAALYASLAWVATIIRERGNVDGAICLGDIGHSPHKIDTPALCCLVDGFNLIRDALRDTGGGRLYIINGNHDAWLASGGVSLIEMFRLASDVTTVVSEPLLTPEGLAFVPYIDNEKFYESYNRLKKSDQPVKCVFFHQSVLGVDLMGHDLHGVDPANLMAVPHISGHIHTRQVVKNVTYIGSLLNHNFSDDLRKQEDARRGAAVVTISDSGVDIDYVANPETPYFVTFNEVDAPAISTSLEKFKGVGEKYFRLRCVGQKESVEKLFPSFDVQYVTPPKESSPPRSTMSVTVTMGDNLKKFAKLSGWPDAQVNYLMNTYAQALNAPVSICKIKSIVIHKLDIENFFSIGRIKLDESLLSGPSMVLVEGRNKDNPERVSNASGKSSMFAALQWVLYGDSDRDVGHSEIIRDGERSCKVVINFSVDGHRYTVKRSRTASGGSLTIMDDQTDTDVTPTHLAAAETYLQTLLTVPQNLFQSIVYFSQGFRANFSQLTPKGRSEVLDDLLDMGAYDSFMETLNSDARKLESEFNQVVQQLSRLEIQKISLTDEIQRSANVLQSLRSEQAAKVNRLRESIVGDEREVYETTQAVSQDDAEIVKLTSQIAELESKRAAMLEQKQMTLALCSSLDSSKADLQRKVDKLRTKMTSAHCDYCGGPVQEWVRAKMLGDLGRERNLKTSEINSANEFKGSVQAQFSKLVNEISALTAAINVVSSRRTGRNNRILSLTSKIGVSIKNLEELENASFDTNEQTIKLCQSKITDIDKSIEDCLAKQVAKADHIQYLGKAMEAFGRSGIRSFLFDALLGKVNQSLEAYASKLLGPSFGCTISAESSTKAGVVKNQVEVSIDSPGKNYKCLSGSEKRLVDIAINLAIQDYLASINAVSNILICDETFDALDSGALEVVVDTLKVLADEKKKAVFLISHNESLKSLVGASIVVEKSGGISRLI